MGLVPATNTCWSDSLLLVECTFESYLARPRRHSSSNCLLNKFGPIRVGPEALLVPHFLLERGWTLYGAQGPLFDLGVLPLHIVIGKKKLGSYSKIIMKSDKKLTWELGLDA